MEKANAHIKMNEVEKGKEFLDKSHEVLKLIFPPENAIFIKILNYQVELESCKDDNGDLLTKSRDLVELSESVNEVKDGTSVFMMDAYLNHVSSCSQCDAESEMQEYYEKLEILGYEVGAHEGTHLFHQAISMKCISMVRKNDHKTARELLEKSYQTQLKQVENDETHPFIESTLSHLGLICKIGRDLPAAENYYTKLIDIKVKFYGEKHETIANPMKNLGNVL